MSQRAPLAHGVVLAAAVDADGPLAGLFLRGPSGAGKSVLALQMIDACPWRRSALVADDQAALSLENGRIIARPPAPLAGLIEVRGYGPAAVRSISATALVAVFDFAALDPAAADARTPPKTMARLFPDGPELRASPFDPTWPAAPARARAMLRAALSVAATHKIGWTNLAGAGP